MRKQRQAQLKLNADRDLPTADILVQTLDRTRELQVMTAGRNLEMLRYLLNMVEHEAEAMLMNEHENASGIYMRDKKAS